MARSMTHERGLAILGHLLRGEALPPTSSKPKDEAAAHRARIADLVTGSVAVAPLVALIHINVCSCGNDWRTFGGWARKAETRLPDQGAVTTTRRLDARPVGEQVSAIEYIRLEHDYCIACYARNLEPVATPEGLPEGAGQ